MKRDVPSPGGTYFGDQTHAETPQKRNMAWQYAVPVGSAAGEAAELRKFNAQSIRNARKKARGAEESEEAPRDYLVVRALLAGIHPGPLGVGPERVKAQRALSQQVLRAEHPPEVRDAVNATRRVCRAEQPPEDRDAANAARRANDQVR